MKGRRLLLLSLVLAALVALALAGAASAARLDVADHGGRPLSTELTGAAEVPPGDLDGSGTATITVNPGQEEVCWEIRVQGITLPATAAHIHVGAAGTARPITWSCHSQPRTRAGSPAVAEPWTATWLWPSSRTPRTTTSTSTRPSSPQER